MIVNLEFSDLDEKCLRYFAASPEEWIRNFIDARIFAAKQEIYRSEVRRMTEDPNITTIPANIDEIVQNANIQYASDQPSIPAMIPPDL